MRISSIRVLLQKLGKPLRSLPISTSRVSLGTFLTGILFTLCFSTSCSNPSAVEDSSTDKTTPMSLIDTPEIIDKSSLTDEETNHEEVIVDSELDASSYELNPEAMKIYEDLLTSLDNKRPGFGEETPNGDQSESAMAYAHLAQAAALVGDLETMHLSATWLVENPSSDLVMGWGLSFAWDAYGDGTVNPPSTIYGITTALAIGGLVESYCRSGKVSYLEAAVESLNYYANYISEDVYGKFLNYSDQSSDNYNTHNVNAMLMHAYARVGVLIDRQDFKQLATEVASSLHAAQFTYPDSISWPYTAQAEAGTRADRNDIVHAAYIAYGVLETQKLLDIEIATQTELENYLKGFERDGNLKEFRTGEFRNEAESDLRARAWGLGMHLAWLASTGDFASGFETAEMIEEYRTSEGTYEYVYGSKTAIPRSTSHLLYGVATLAAEKTTIKDCVYNPLTTSAK